MRPVLCMVTDRARLSTTGSPEDALVDLVGDAARAGVHLVQVREKDLEGGALLRLVERCVAAVHGTGARVLVNDRADVALAAGAHGVHLPSNGVSGARVRAKFPPDFVIGRSVHDRDDAIRVAREGGLDYLLFGTVFATASKPGLPGRGVEALRDVAAAVPLPVVAIGGMTIERLSHVASTHAAGVAAIGLFAGEKERRNLQTTVTEAYRAFDTYNPVP